MEATAVGDSRQRPTAQLSGYSHPILQSSLALPDGRSDRMLNFFIFTFPCGRHFLA